MTIRQINLAIVQAIRDATSLPPGSVLEAQQSAPRPPRPFATFEVVQTEDEGPSFTSITPVGPTAPGALRSRHARYARQSVQVVFYGAPPDTGMDLANRFALWLVHEEAQEQMGAAGVILVSQSPVQNAAAVWQGQNESRALMRLELRILEQLDISVDAATGVDVVVDLGQIQDTIAVNL